MDSDNPLIGKIIPSQIGNVTMQGLLTSQGISDLYVAETEAREGVLVKHTPLFDKAAELYHREISFYEQISHKYILSYYGHYEEESDGFLILEASNYGSLSDLEEQEDFQPDTILQIVKLVLLGLNHLHSGPTPIAHRNIISENIMLSKDGYFKLTNFTSSKYLCDLPRQGNPDFDAMETVHSSIIAPEQTDTYTHYNVTTKIDIWAVGCLAFKLLMKSDLWDETNWPDMVLASISGEKPQHQLIWKNSLLAMLEANPNKRGDASQCLQHLAGRKVQTTPKETPTYRPLQAPVLSSTIRPNAMKEIINRSTNSWVREATAATDTAPDRYYFKKLLQKAHEKPNKIQKFYSAWAARVDKGFISCLKSLLLVQMYLNKGPPSVFTMGSAELYFGVVQRMQALNHLKKFLTDYASILKVKIMYHIRTKATGEAWQGFRITTYEWLNNFRELAHRMLHFVGGLRQALVQFAVIQRELTSILIYESIAIINLIAGAMTQPEIQTQPQFEQACRDLKRIYDAYKSIKNSLTAYRLEFDIQLDESTIGDLIALTQRDRESDVRTTNTPGQNITLKPPAQPKSNQPGLQSQPSKSAPKLQMQTEEQKQPRKVPPKLQIKQKEDEIDYVNLTQGAAQPQIKKKGSLPTTPTRQQMVAEQESLLLTFREQPAPQASAPPVNFPVAWSQPDQSKPSTNPQLSSAWPQPEQTKPSTNPQLPSAWPQPDQSKPSTTPSQAWPQPAQVKPSGSQQIPVQPLAQQAPPQNPLSNVAPPQQPGINSMFDTPRPGSIPMNPGAFNSNPKPQQAKPQQMSASQQVRQPTPFQQAQIQPSAPQKPQPAQQIPAQAKAAGQVPQSAQQAPQLSAPQKPQPIQQIPAQIKAVGHVPMSAQQAPQPSQTPNWQQAPIQQKPQNQPSINQAAQMPFPGYPNMQQDAWSIPQHQIIAMQQMALAQHAQMAQSKYGTPPANMAQMQMQMQAMNLAQQGAPSGKQFPVQHQKQMQPSAQQMAAPRPQAAAQRPPAQPTPIQNQPQNQIPKQQPQQPVSNQNMPNQPQIPSQPNPQVQKQRQKRRSSEADVKKTVQSAMVKALVPNAVPVEEPQQAPAVPEQSRMAQQPVAQEDNQPPVAPPPQQPQFAVQPAWPTQQRSNTPQQANNVGEENSTNRPVVQQPPPQNKPIGAVSFPQAQVDQHLKPQAPVAPPAQQYTIEIAKKMLANSGRLILNSEIQRDHVAIANGASAVVYRAMYRNQLVAVKYMLTNQMNQNNIKEFIREIDALMNMNHKNLVQFMGAQIEGTLAIVMEYCEGDSLFKLLHQSKASLSWAQKLTICKDTANAIYYMHKLQKPIIHRDLKSLNILLKKPVNGETDNVHALVTDFGISRHLGDTPEQFMTGQAGTYHWMAPEVISSQPYNLSADIYSLGIVFWEVCSRKTPYDGLHPVQIAQQVVFQNLRPNLNVLPTSAAKMKALIQSCWAGNPTDRPTIDQVVNILNTFA